jgi:hypothetical protein
VSGPDLVWYIAYGSNLCRARFERYLAAIDPVRPPIADRTLWLGHRLFFAHESRVWTGGSAFVDPIAGETTTRARAWLIDRAQFVSVLSQENGGAIVSVDDSMWSLGVGEAIATTDQRYGLVVGCTPIDGVPALTFTTPGVPLPVATRPSPDYVDVIATGLAESHCLDRSVALAYLTDHGGGPPPGHLGPD